MLSSASAASASTVRSPWQSRSNSSSRLGLETAFPIRAKLIVNRVFELPFGRSRVFHEDIQLFNSSLEY